MKKQINKYRLGYSIYRRNVPQNEIVYGEKDGRLQYCKINDEEEEVKIEGLLILIESLNYSYYNYLLRILYN